MIFNRQSAQDINKYYAGTYLKFNETGDRIFRIIDVMNEGLVKAEDSSGFEIYIDLDEDYTVNYIIPGRRIFQMNENAAMIYRKPARQYYRGMHPENTGFAVLTPDTAWKEIHLDFSMIETFVNKNDYIKVEEIEHVKYQHYASWAIDDQIAVNKHGQIMFGNIDIGKLQPLFKKGFFTPIYERECKEIFKNLNYSWASL